MSTTTQPPVRRRKSSGIGQIRITKVLGPARPRPATPAPKMVLAEKIPGKPEAPTKVLGVDPVDAIGLRSAFGLRTDRESCERTAKEATAHVKAAVAKAAKAAAAKAEVPSAHTQPVPTSGASAAATPFVDPKYAVVWQFIYAAWQRNGRRSVSFDPLEAARATGLSVEQVNAAIAVLEETGQIRRDPFRAGSAFPRFSPVI
jgi:hypothetical protein